MTVHASEWQRMTTEERVDHLRLQLFAQEAIIMTMIEGLRRIGINLVMGREADQPDE